MSFIATLVVFKFAKACSYLFGILRIPPFVNDKGKDVKSDWLANQWDERSVLGHARVNKGRMNGDDPQIDTAQNPKRFDWRLAIQRKIQKTFADSIPNKYGGEPARLPGWPGRRDSFHLVFTWRNSSPLAETEI